VRQGRQYRVRDQGLYRHEPARPREGQPTRSVTRSPGGNHGERFATPPRATALLAAPSDENGRVGDRLLRWLKARRAHNAVRPDHGPDAGEIRSHAGGISRSVSSKLQRRADLAWQAAARRRNSPEDVAPRWRRSQLFRVNIGTVSAALGHASVTITCDRYHHLTPGTMDAAASLIQANVDNR